MPLRATLLPEISYLLLGIACALVPLDSARADGPVVNDAPRPSVTVPKATVTPLVTADPQDPAWKNGAVLSPLTVSINARPHTGALPETKIMLLWDQAFLYIRFFCHSDHIYTPVHGRDADVYKGDAVELFIDPVGDAHAWIEMQFNADNDIFDQIFLCTTEPKWDTSLHLTPEVNDRDVWNFPSWDFKGLRSHAMRLPATAGEQNWMVDIAMPATTLLRRKGLKQFQPMTLKANFIRYQWNTSDPANPTLLPLNWGPVTAGNPHRCPAAYGSVILSP